MLVIVLGLLVNKDCQYFVVLRQNRPIVGQILFSISRTTRKPSEESSSQLQNLLININK